ncbi:MAG: serine hydrolase, partial [Fulvivirga sp.]|nr:serine hydrolase [Fulvivirga sp.]
MRIIFIIGGILTLLSCNDMEQTPLEEAMNSDAWVRKVANDPVHEVQIIYTRISRDSLQRPSFKSYTFNLDTTKYFYPASTAKFPVALLALERLNELNIDSLDKNSSMITDSAYSGQTSVVADTTSETGLPSIAHYIRKLFIVSDNDAYNRLYEFLGQDYINQKLTEKGYTDTRICHRLSIPLSEEQNRHTNPIRFYEDTTLVYEQPAREASRSYKASEPILKGEGYYQGDSLIQKPFNFQSKNAFPLDEQHRMLKAVMFPEHVQKNATFNLTRDDYEFLHYCMHTLPRESIHPSYDS